MYCINKQDCAMPKRYEGQQINCTVKSVELIGPEHV